MTSLAAWTLAPLAAEIATDVLLKATVLLGLAWIATRLLGHASAATRHGLWSLALVGLLAVPLLSACLPAWTVGLPEPVRHLAARAATPLSSAPPATTPSATERPALYPEPETPAPDGRTVVPPVPSKAPVPALAFVALWASGVLFLLGRLALHMARLRLLAWRAEPAPDGPRADEAQRHRFRLGIERPVRVIYSDRVPMAMTWGVRRPVVLFPDAARHWSEERYRMVLLHELAHVKRWDYAWHVAAQVARALYWFNPLVWIATRRLYLEQERSCDDYVLRDGTGACTYAAHLVDIARTLLRRPAPSTGNIAMARRSTLKERVQAILNTRSNRCALSLRTGLSAAGLSLCLVLPLAALQLGAAPPDRDASRAALLRHEDPSLRARAVRAMGLHADPADVPALLQALNDAEPAVRAAAVQALGARGGAAAVEYVAAAALHDDCPDVRAAAVRALGRICACNALSVVPSTLRDPHPAVRTAAASVLRRRIATLQTDGSPDADCTLQRGLPGVVPALVAALHDDDARVRQHAAAALGDAGDPDTFGALKDALHDAAPHVRREAVQAIGKIGTPCAAAALRPALDDENLMVREAAVRALTHLETS